MPGSRQRSGLVVLVIALGLMAAAIPCPDDLAVETGAPDQCAASRSPDDSPAPTSICLCACHVAYRVTPRVLVETGLPVADFEAPEPTSGLDGVPSPISHPPLA